MINMQIILLYHIHKYHLISAGRSPWYLPDDVFIGKMQTSIVADSHLIVSFNRFRSTIK